MSCYICGQPHTSIEHAPARCFFPEDKRVNLITVDSCTTHNEDTSKDDEYVRNIIAMSLGNNGVALNHFLTKCVRSFLKSPKLLKATTNNQQKVYYQATQQQGVIPTKAFGIDRQRVDFVLKKIAYALYFKKFGTPWNRELLIGTEYLRTQGMEADDLGQLIQSAKLYLTPPTYEGANLDVFKYSFLESESADTNDQLLIMVFYEGFEVWVFPQAETTGPNLER